MRNYSDTPMKKPATRVLAGLAVLLLALCVERVRSEFDMMVLVVSPAPLLVLASAAWGARLDAVIGERRASIARSAMAMVATLAVLAGTGVDSSSPLLLLMALPLIVIGGRFGSVVSTLAWLGTSLLVVGWSLVSWSGEAEPLLEPIVTLVIVWLAAFAAGSTSSHLADHALAFEVATTEANERASIAGTILQATADFAAAERDRARLLVSWAERIVPAPEAGPRTNDREHDRELALRAVDANGVAVVESASGDGCRLGVFVAGPRAEVLVLATDGVPSPVQVEAVELLGLLYRGLQARTSPHDRRGADGAVGPTSIRPASPPASAAPIPLRSSGQQESGGEASEFYQLLGADADDLIEALFAGPPHLAPPPARN